MKIVALISILLIELCALQSNIVNELKYTNDGINAVCKLKKTEIKNISDKDRKIFGIKCDKRTVVFAKLSLVNSSKNTKTINLRNYYVSLHSKRSSKIYIDSYVDYLITDKELQPKEMFTVDVYWVFDGTVSQNDFDRLKLIYVP